MKNSKCAPAAYAAVNDLGKRIGEGHPRAILTDRDVELLLELRDEGWGWKRLASKFECSKRHVRDVCAGRRRGQPVASWVPLGPLPKIVKRRAPRTPQRRTTPSGEAWALPVGNWLASRYTSALLGGSKAYYPAQCTLDDVFAFALGLPAAAHTHKNRIRLGALMRRLGWDQRAVYTDASGSRIPKMKRWVRLTAPTTVQSRP